MRIFIKDTTTIHTVDKYAETSMILKTIKAIIINNNIPVILASRDDFK